LIVKRTKFEEVLHQKERIKGLVSF